MLPFLSNLPSNFQDLHSEEEETIADTELAEFEKELLHCQQQLALNESARNTPEGEIECLNGLERDSGFACTIKIREAPSLCIWTKVK